MTWCPIPADLVQVFLNKEVTPGTFLEAGATRYYPLAFGHTLGHTPIQRPPHPGGRQAIHVDSNIFGAVNPSTRLTVPLRYDDAELQLEAVLGGVSTAGAWAIGSSLSSWSVGFTDTLRYWKYAGGMVADCAIDASFGSPTVATISFMHLGRTDAAAGGFPSLSAAPTLRPYILEDCAILGDASTPVATALQPQGFSLNISNGLIQNRAPGSHYPNCIVPGAFTVTGSMRFEASAEFESVLRAACDAFTTYYVQCTWTTGAKLVKLLMPVRFILPEHSTPEGNAPLSNDVSFVAAADDFALTTETLVATSTAY